MTLRRAVPVLVLLALLPACTPMDDSSEPERPGSAAPDLTPETTPPPVPVVRDDTLSQTEPFDATGRTDLGAVVPDTASAIP